MLVLFHYIVVYLNFSSIHCQGPMYPIRSKQMCHCLSHLSHPQRLQHHCGLDKMILLLISITVISCLLHQMLLIIMFHAWLPFLCNVMLVLSIIWYTELIDLFCSSDAFFQRFSLLSLFS